MTPAIYDLECPQGTTFTRTLILRENNVAMNLSGYSARMQVRNLHTSASVALTPTVTVTGATGTITLNVSASTTAALAPISYVYDLEIESGGGVVTRVLEGNFVVSPEVTR